MEPSVQSLCNLLSRSRLLSADEIRALHQRWTGEAKSAADDVERFCHWLVANRHVTEYQANLLRRGKADHFFLGPYKLLERVGKGRMAGVYSAVHRLGQTVAIKVLPPSKAKDAALLARFQREARLALKLRHPHVVRTFQMGRTDGLHYIVMEYLDGETLGDVLARRGRLPPAEAVRVVHQALLGLQHLHEVGLVHRDLKPANLMLVPAPAAGAADTTLHATVKIMDIGLGRAMFDEGSEGAADFGLTNEGALLGTPDYLAPEQARDARSADIRADVYSLGCVLYHLLGGQPPFADTNLMQQLMRHATEAPRPLSLVNPAVPEGLDQIVGWMLAKDPARRYPTPGRAAAALQVFLSAGAGADPAPAGTNPQMKAYVQWVESQSDVADAEPAAAPTRPAGRTLPGPVAVARPVASPPPPRAARGPRAAKPEPPQIDVELVEPSLAKEGKTTDRAATDQGRISRRDYMLLGAGAAVGAGTLLALELFLYLLLRLLSPRKEPAAEDAGAPQTPEAPRPDGGD